MTRKAIYATRDFDNGHVSQDASISKFATLEAARAFLLEGYDPKEWDIDSAVIEPCPDFGDCWIKSNGRPKIGTPWIAPFSYTQVRVERPGQHPGGNRYWTTPIVDVLVIAEIRERADA